MHIEDFFGQLPLNNKSLTTTYLNKHKNLLKKILVSAGRTDIVYPTTTLALRAFLVCLKRSVLGAEFTRQENRHKMMCLIILSCFTIPHDAMEITMTCHPWSLKRTIL